MAAAGAVAITVVGAGLASTVVAGCEELNDVEHCRSNAPSSGPPRRRTPRACGGGGDSPRWLDCDASDVLGRCAPRKLGGGGAPPRWLLCEESGALLARAAPRWLTCVRSARCERLLLVATDDEARSVTADAGRARCERLLLPMLLLPGAADLGSGFIDEIARARALSAGNSALLGTMVRCRSVGGRTRNAYPATTDGGLASRLGGIGHLREPRPRSRRSLWKSLWTFGQTFGDEPAHRGHTVSPGE